MYPRPPRHAAVVLDCDNTLVRNDKTWRRAYAAIASRCERTISSTERDSLVGLGKDALGHALGQILDRPDQSAELGEEVYELVANNLGDPIVPLLGAVDLVMSLNAARWPLAVASNSPAAIVNRYLTAIGLARMFDTIIGSDDVDQPKPAPHIYLVACARLAVAPEDAVAIEDSPTGVAAARAAGMYVIGVPSRPGLALAADAVYPNLADPRLRQALHIPIPSNLRWIAQPERRVA